MLFEDLGLLAVLLKIDNHVNCFSLLRRVYFDMALQGLDHHSNRGVDEDTPFFNCMTDWKFLLKFMDGRLFVSALIVIQTKAKSIARGLSL
jgi:hypothetical protein